MGARGASGVTGDCGITMAAVSALYENVVPGWNDLPAAVRRVHEPGESDGTFVVERGTGLLTALIAAAGRLPSVSAAAAVRLRVTARGAGQTWERSIGAQRMTSHQEAAERSEILERYGPVECRLAASATDGTLVMESLGAALRVGSMRLRLPAWLAPVIDARAAAEGDAARVDVAIRSGWGGLLVRYHGLVRSR
jgi:hypothetical protein